MKTKALLWIIIIVGIFIVIFLFSKGTKKQVPLPTPEGPVAYEVMTIDSPNIEIMETVVIKTEKEWEDKLGKAPSGIDFNQQEVLLINMGKRMTGGYSINMKSIDAKEGKINANIEFVSPGKNCITIQAITYPFLLISIPSSPSEVVWNISNRVEDCPQ